LAKKKKLDTGISPETPQAAPDKETYTTDKGFIPQLVSGNWAFGIDCDELAVMSRNGNWIWRGVAGEQLAQDASEMAELAKQMIAAGH
jgi:hypothetical protein